MVSLSWDVYVDLDDDGVIEHALVGVQTLTIEHGFNQPFQVIAMPERVKLTLVNPDGRYSPEHGGALAGLERGRLMRVEFSDGVTTETMALTRVGKIRPEPGQYDGFRAWIDNESWLELAREGETPVAIQVNERGSTLIKEAVDAYGLYPPADQVSPGNWSALDVGTNVFPFAFDVGSRDLYSRLRNVAASEGHPSRVFLNRDGELEFWDQAHFTDTAATAALDNAMYDLDYSYADLIVNQVTVRTAPRKFEDSGPYTLATLQSAARVRPGEAEVITLRYSGEEGARISTTDPIDPVATTDWVANSNEDGSGSDMTGDFVVTATHTAQGSIWEVENNGTTTGYIMPGATQRANNRLTAFEPLDVFREDAASVAAHRQHPLELTMPFQNSSYQASGLARLLLERFAQPRGVVRAVSFYPLRNATLLDYALNCTMGSRVTVTETKIGHSQDYIIVGERHELAQAGRDYRLTWYLEPEAGFLRFWLLGVAGRSDLGVTTIIGP